ncbi:hypothetical protein, partial [Specibacter sp. NPDC078709]|uniref:hypothetical protein n=1 Tax=Specibacter sp. NPDC078709 TaxID=3154364 RepID=UPI00343946B2
MTAQNSGIWWPVDNSRGCGGNDPATDTVAAGPRQKRRHCCETAKMPPFDVNATVQTLAFTSN